MKGFHLVELPYEGGRFSLVCLTALNAADLPALSPLLTSDNLQSWLKGALLRECDVELPRFKIAGASRDLTPMLQELGLKTAFGDKADFHRISPEPGLHMNSVYQQCLIAVDENGSVAAAVTAAGALGGDGVLDERMPFIPHFRADRPFWYFLRDQKTGAILFCGRLSRPE